MDQLYKIKVKKIINVVINLSRFCFDREIFLNPKICLSSSYNKVLKTRTLVSKPKDKNYNEFFSGKFKCIFPFLTISKNVFQKFKPQERKCTKNIVGYNKIR